LDLKAEMLKKSNGRSSRLSSSSAAKPHQPRAVGSRATGKQTRFRYLKTPEKVPAGIMSIVHSAIKELKEGTVADVTVEALSSGLGKVTGQDPTTQTSIMLHRMLHAGVVEVMK